MKKLIILTVLLEMSLLTVIFFSRGYALDFPRHKNPAQIQEESFFPAQLIFLYAKVVSLQVAGKWDSASSELKRTYLTYIPEPLRYIFTRFNELIQAAGDKLKMVKGDIDSAEAFLRQGEVGRAGKILEGAWLTLLKAERDLNNLNSSVGELRGRIGANAGERLRKEIIPLGKLAEGYKNRIQDLYREVREGKRLEATFLEILAAEKKVMVGSSFEVYGKLKKEAEKPLSGRKVDIFLEKERIFKAITDEDGEFRARRDFPLLYKRQVRVSASFIPQGEDKEKFYPSVSNEISLEPVFHTPQIRASYQEPVYPVLPFKVQGEVMLKDIALTDYPVKIKLAQRMTQINTDEKGKFQAQLSLPSGVGKTFPLTILTPSRGVIGPASLTINLPVTYKVPSMMVDLPLVAVSPFPLELKGEVDLRGEPMKDATLMVITEKEDVRTFVRGKAFKVKLDVPLSTFSGPQRIRIFLHPQEAWISPLNQEKKVLVVNPLTLLPFIGLFALFVGVSSRRKKEVEETERVLEEGEKAASGEKVGEEKELARMIRIYTEAVNVVARLTGIEQTPGHTVREYLRLVQKPLGKRYDNFAFISFAAEKFLYGSTEISEEEVEEVQRSMFEVRESSMFNVRGWKRKTSSRQKAKGKRLRAKGRKVRRALISGMVAGVVAVILLIRFFPPNDDFNLNNPFWNGLKDFKAETKASPLTPVSRINLIPSPSGTLLFIIGPSSFYSDEEVLSISEYLKAGGTLVLADDFGSGNSVLEGLRLRSRFSRHLVVDPLFRGKSSVLTKLVDTAGPLTSVDNLMFNYPASLGFDAVEGKIIATSSSFSFFDDNLNGKREKGEDEGPFPMIAEIPYGKGRIYLISDASLFINSMLGEGENGKSLKNIIKGKTVFIDISHHPMGILAKLKDGEIRMYQLASRFEVRYAILLVLVIGIVWGKKKKFNVQR